MWSAERTGFRQQDYSFISEKQMERSRAKMVQLIAKKLAGWEIFIKPYPSGFAGKSASEIKESFTPVPKNVSVVDSSKSADEYIEMSNVIVGISASTTLFTASMQCPEKIIISLNLNNELLGDSYKDFEGIDYIDTEEKLIRALDLIENGDYQKKENVAPRFDFTDVSEFISHLLYEKRIH